MATPQVQLPAALQRRRRRALEEAGPGFTEDGEPISMNAPNEQAPAQPTAQPAPRSAQAAPPELEEEDEVEIEEEHGEEDVLGDDADDMDDLMSLIEQRQDPPAKKAPASSPDQARLLREQQQLREEREALEAERAQLAAERKALSAEAAPALKAPGVDAKTAEHYKGSNAYIDHRALEAVGGQLNPILETIIGRISALEAEAATATQQATSAAETVRSAEARRFNAALRQKFGDIQALTRNPRLGQFLSRAQQYSPNKTLRDAFRDAVSRYDVDMVSRLLTAFIKSEEAAGRPVEAMGAGRKTGGTQNSLPGRKSSGKLPWSVRSKAWDDRRSGKISAEAFAEIKKQYEAAVAADNVDYNA